MKAEEAAAKDIIKVTWYIVDYDPCDRSSIESYLQSMGDHRPASTLVGVASLVQKNVLYKIEAMASFANA